jgi:iron complex transport system substrate-binding protein
MSGCIKWVKEQKEKPQMRLSVFEKSATVGRGLPYDPERVAPEHLLNVQAVSSMALPDAPISYFYELDNTYFSVTSNTFVGQIMSQFNMQNIADLAEAGNDYPQLSQEAIISANPQLIFLADTKCCQQDAKTVAARPGWSKIDAVTSGNVVELDDDVASRWGPRVVDLVKQVAAAVAKFVETSKK